MRWSHVLASLLCGTLAGLAPPGATAVSAQQTPTFRAGVDLVQVDVVVLDAAGRPVPGLTAADFILVDRGTERAIATLAEVAHDGPAQPPFPAGVAADIASNQTAASERLVILVVDDLHVQNRTDVVKGLAHRVVDKIGSDVSLGLVTTSGEYGVEITEDRERIRREIDRFDDRVDPAAFPHRGGPRPPSTVSGAEDLGMLHSPSNLARFFGGITAYSVVEDVARMIGASDGRRRAVVWISAGVPGAGLIERFLEGKQCADNKANVFSLTDAWHCDSMVGMLEDLQRASITTYTVHPGGRSMGGSLEAFARETGGFAVRPDDLDDGITRLVADLDNYYLLGFYPDSVAGADYHEVEVRVRRPGLTVRHRRGYSSRGPREPPANESPLGALVAGVMPSTDLPLRLQVVPLLTGGGKAQVAIALEVDLEGFSDDVVANGTTDTVEYGLFIADLDKGRLTDGKIRTLDMTWSPEDAARPGAHRFIASNVIDLPPGRYQLRASAISSAFERQGSVYLLFDVPNPKAAPAAISGLAVTATGREDDHPTVVDAVMRQHWPLPFRPGFERTFSRSDTLRLFFQTRREGGPDEVAGLVAVEDERGEVVATLPFSAGRGLAGHDIGIPLAGLADGAYALVVTVSDERGTATRNAGFWIGR